MGGRIMAKKSMFGETNLVSKYFGNTVGSAFKDTRLIAGSLAGGVLVSQLVARYTDNQDIAKVAGILTSASGGLVPAILSVVVYNPKFLDRLRGRS
jgi:hypothetical protein